MKVLHIINSFQGGGAEKLMLQLHEISLAQDVNSHALSLMSSSANGLHNTYSLNFDNPYRMLVLFKLYSFLKEPYWRDLDIVHVHLFPSQLFVPIVLKFLNIHTRLITTEHSTSNRRRSTGLGKMVDKLLYAFYTKVVCISAGTSTLLHQWQPQIADKLEVIYNGINHSEYSSNAEERQYHKAPIIASVGRLVKLKNFEAAIQALNNLSDRSFEYWILGSGPLEADLKSLVKSLGMESKVKFLGFRKDIPDLLRQADIFLLPSLWEGFGLAVVEAMAAGLPVVVSNVPGLQEIVPQESQAGFLVDPASPNDIADALDKLLEDPDLRSQMGKKGQLQAARFDIRNTALEYLNLYNRVS
jgi:glycosyltransferase involved in cell wall biosynthesis